MITASLVIYHHRFDEIHTMIDCVLKSTVRQLYIIDHSPTDFLRQTLSKYSSRIHYIHSENRGYGAGHNIAIFDTMKKGTAFHVVINPDIEFIPGSIEKIVAYMQKNPDVGLLMPEIISPDGSLQYNCKLLPTPFDLLFKRFLPQALTKKRMDHFMMKSSGYNRIMDVPYLCGCFMVFRLETLAEVGLFDERFFLYPEDIDITRRVYSSRFRSIYFPEVSVVHIHAAASRSNGKMLWIHIFNMIRYFNKWGWFFDRERRQINREVLEKLKSPIPEKTKASTSWSKKWSRPLTPGESSVCLVLILLTGMLLRVLAWHWEPTISRDGVHYVELVEQWRKTGVFPQSAYLPLLPWGMRYLMVFGLDAYHAGIYLNLLAGSLLALVAYGIVRFCTARREIAMAAALLTGINPLAVNLAINIQRDTFYLLFAGGAIFFALYAIRTGKWFWWAACSLSMTFGLLSRYETLELLPLIMLYFVAAPLCGTIRWRTAIKGFLVWSIASCLFLSGIVLLMGVGAQTQKAYQWRLVRVLQEKN